MTLEYLAGLDIRCSCNPMNPIEMIPVQAERASVTYQCGTCLAKREAIWWGRWGGLEIRIVKN